MPTTDNIISFPKKNTETEDININAQSNLNDLKTKIDDNIELMKIYHINQSMEFIISVIFTQLQIAGFNIIENSNVNFKDNAMIVESIRSLLMKTHGLYHPIQVVAENILVKNEDSENGDDYKIPDVLNISLKKEDHIKKEDDEPASDIN